MSPARRDFLRKSLYLGLALGLPKPVLAMANGDPGLVDLIEAKMKEQEYNFERYFRLAVIPDPGFSFFSPGQPVLPFWKTKVSYESAPALEGPWRRMTEDEVNELRGDIPDLEKHWRPEHWGSSDD